MAYAVRHNGTWGSRHAPTVEEVRRRTRPILADDPRVRFAYLFGSTASDAAVHDRLAEAMAGTGVDLLVPNGAPLWIHFRAVAGLVLTCRAERDRIAERERVEKQFLDFKPYYDEYLRATRDRAARGCPTSTGSPRS